MTVRCAWLLPPLLLAACSPSPSIDTYTQVNRIDAAGRVAVVLFADTSDTEGANQHGVRTAFNLSPGEHAEAVLHDADGSGREFKYEADLSDRILSVEWTVYEGGRPVFRTRQKFFSPAGS